MKQSKRIVLFTRVVTVALAFSIALVCGPAMGQEAVEKEFLLEEIVVTAEFREKAIQDTPISISAINEEMMEVRNQVTLDQISMQVPGVILRPNNSGMGSSLVAFIRGIGQTDFNPAVEPGVAIYVDDVYYSTITANILDLLDLERVEILRGPQGTLAGRNAIGGAIKLFTRQADGQDDGSVSLTYGDFDRLDVKAAAGLTIVPDKLFARIAGVSRSRDGYVTRLDYACANNLGPPGTPGGFPTYTTARGGLGCEIGKEGGQSMTAGRLSLRWTPSDRFEVNFSTNIVRDKSESQPSVLINAADNSGTSVPVISSPSTIPPVAPSPAFNPNSVSLVPTFFDNNGNGIYDAGIDVPYDRRFVTGGTYYNYATYINDGRSTPSPLYQGGNPGQDNSIYKPDVLPPINYLTSEDYTLSINWKLSDSVSLLSVSSYREYLNEFSNDEDESPLGLGQLFQRMDHEQWTQELRLSAALWEGADLTVGGFYLDKETNEDARVDINYAAFDFLHGPDIVPSKSKALYGQLAWDLSERTDLTLGLRYSKDEKSYTFHRHNPDGTPVGPPVTIVGFFEAGNPSNSGVFGLDGLSIDYSSSRLDYRAALGYDINENVMVYGQIATGYKAGGNNARPFFPTQIHATDPEELINYEIGVKSTLFNQLRLNAAVFYNDYSDMQLMVSVCKWAPAGQQTPCASVANVGDAEIKGFELEALWYPTKDLTIDFSYAYLDFEYKTVDPLTGVSPDSKAPFTPENKWSLGAQYKFKLGKGLGTLTPRVDIAWQDDVYTSALNTTAVFVPAYAVYNGRLTWQSADLKWQASLEGTNLDDKYYYLTIYDLMTGAGYVNGQPSRPREWAFTIKRSWLFD
ncbi:MAG: TonB-dependent receptor [Deltaproteobacteria bacterium]|nr:TonB-dependent receptor [Deltaproteobacteria bacterium]